MDVQSALALECESAQSLALTQATQMGATQRAGERSRIRSVVLDLPIEQVQQHIEQAEAGDAASRQFSLVLYSLSNLLPDDTAEIMATCQERLERYMLAILTRIIACGAYAPFSPLICRVAKQALSGVGEECSCAVIDHILQAISKKAAVAPLLVDLLPVALGQLCHGSADGEDSLLRQAKAQQVVSKLCALKWPGHLTAPLLAALRSVQLTPQQEQQLLTAAFEACSSIAVEYLAASAYEALLLSSGGTPVPRLQAVCEIVDSHREDAAAQGSTAAVAVLAAQAELLTELLALFARDKAVANAWLKEFKRSRAASVTAFALTVGTASIARCAAAALDALKCVVLNVLKHVEALDASSWLSQLSGGHGAELRSLAQLTHFVVAGSDAALAPTIVQVAMHLIVAGKLKDIDVTALRHVDGKGYTGLAWWEVTCSSAARLCLVGVALLEQV